MDVMFQFINFIEMRKGQLLLAFFSLLVTKISWSQPSAFVQADHVGSSGLAVAKHWISEGLLNNNSNDWINYRLESGVSFGFNHGILSISEKKQGFLAGNNNSLFLAAQKEINEDFDVTGVGDFDVNAEVWTVKSTNLGFKYIHKIADGLKIEFMPYIMNIHDYQYSTGRFNFITQDNNKKLTGKLTRTGMRNYGFLTNDKPDVGWGMGLDIFGEWKSNWGVAQVKVENIFSELRFQTIHQSARQYNLTSTNGKLNIGKVPSVTGEYGYTSLEQKLPVTWLIGFQPHGVRGVTTALIGQNSDARWAITYEKQIGDGRLWTRTVSARNWSVGIDWNFYQNINAGIGITADKNLSSPVVSNFHLTAHW